MFNPLTPSQMVTAIGQAAGAAGRRREALDQFERGQLMSAYSASRHLAIELNSFSAPLRRACEKVADATSIAAERLSDGGDSQALAALADRVRTADGPAEAGETIADLLALARAHTGASWTQLRSEVQACLRDLCRREVSLLAEGIEAGRA